MKHTMSEKKTVKDQLQTQYTFITDRITLTTNKARVLPGPRRMTFGNRPLYSAKNLQRTTYKIVAVNCFESPKSNRKSQMFH